MVDLPDAQDASCSFASSWNGQSVALQTGPGQQLAVRQFVLGPCCVPGSVLVDDGD